MVHFSSPNKVTASRPDSAAQTTHFPAEIAQAGVDIGCKLSTNLVGIDFAV